MSTIDRQAKRFLREPAAYELKGAITPCMALWQHMTPKAVQGLVNAASRACHKLDALESQCDALEDRVADAAAENAELQKTNSAIAIEAVKAAAMAKYGNTAPARLAADIMQAIVEMPGGYDSPEDQPDLVQCTVQELQACIEQVLEEAFSAPANEEGER